MFKQVDKGIFFKYECEIVLLEAYGDGIRFRSTQNTSFSQNVWALLPNTGEQPIITINSERVSLTNGKIRADIDAYGRLSFYNVQGKRLLHEQYRCADLNVDFSRKDIFDEFFFTRKRARQYSRSTTGYKTTLTFDSNDYEKLYGMGQYQDPYLNIKGCTLELAHLNTQTSVPFLLSNLGYGMLWNNPGTGHVNFAKNFTQWNMDNTQELDYWVTAGDCPAEIVENYARIVGTVPIIPDFALGFWQSKLRYQTQDELLNVAREYKRRNIKLDVIVLDYFHWTNQGDWKFDLEYWPNPKAMVEELRSMGIKLMVSIWPTVDRYSENNKELIEKDLLLRAEKGLPYSMDFLGTLNFIDLTNPEARAYLWEKCRKNYFEYGIELYWLDVAEPEFYKRDYDIYRYYLGQASECTNIYPLMYAKTFYEGLVKENIENPISLIRSAWAGSQRYGALGWSGDLPASFTQLHYQISILLNMGLAGITWYTCDIGGFHGANINDPEYHELIIRWFQFGTFCPVMRLHGDRDPHTAPITGTLGGGLCNTGAPNEVWSYGEQVEQIFIKYINIRYALKPYIKNAMMDAHAKGTPIAKPLFYNYPDDEKAWDIQDEYLFGDDILVAPIYKAKCRQRDVYFPNGDNWLCPYTNMVYAGGQTAAIYAPLNIIPIFVKQNSSVLNLLKAEI